MRNGQPSRICHATRPIGRTLFVPVVCFLFVLSYGLPARAQYQRHLESILPRVGQQGTTVEVLIHGLHLEDPQQILFYRPGIRAEKLETLPDLQQFDEDGKLNPPDKRPGGRLFGAKVIQQVKAKFIIEPDCPIGLHPLKMRTGDHLTTLGTFWVTPHEVYTEQEPIYGEGVMNDTPEQSEKLENKDLTVFGYIRPGSFMDHDVYRISRKKGERISVEVNSVRNSFIWWARAELDLLVRVLDEQGNELVLEDDSALHVQDPILSFLAPADGDYFIEIRQSLFTNYNNSFYTHYFAHIGTYERPQAVYPAGGQAGESLPVTLIGDPQGEIKRTVTLPNEIGDYPYDYGGPSILPMRVSNFRNVLEEASTADSKKPSITEAGKLPVALNGIIAGPNQTDAFRFQPEKGQVYIVRAFSRSLGTPLDPEIEIVHAETGEVEATGDDVRNYDERGLPGLPSQFRRQEVMDPSLVWTPKQEGNYLLRIRDIRNQGSPTCVYRVEMYPAENRVNTFVYSRNYNRESTRDTGLTIPQGNRWTVQFYLSPGPGNPYRGELELVAEGLPTGVEMIAPPIKPVGGGYPNSIPVQFVANADTPPQAVLLRVLAKPKEQGVEFHSRGGQAFLFVGDHFGQSSNSLHLEQYALAVTNPAPYSLEVEQPRIPLIQNGELSVNVKLHRQPGFDDPVLIGSIWNPGGVGSEPTLEIPAGQTEAIYRFTASASAAPGTWPVALHATTLPLEPKDVAGTGQLRVSSKFFDLTVAQPYVELASEPVAIRRGSDTKFVWRVKHLNPFQTNAAAKLIGLPKGITTKGEPPVLTPKTEELVFELQADTEALLGQYKEIGVVLTFRQDGQEIQQQTGSGALRIDPQAQQP